MPDVVAYERNAEGSDYVVGDVHGTNMAFKKVIESLGDHDRLFLVGDLTDRGPGSLDIIKQIIAANEGKNPPVVYAVRGNHEEMLLNAIKVLQKSLSKLTFKDAQDLAIFLRNGGEWIFNQQEDADKIKSLHMEGNLQGIIKFLIEHYAVELCNSTELERIRSFIEALPYAIRVGQSESDNPFIVCHADMPLRDELLDRIIDEGYKLSVELKRHITWARNEEFLKGQRDQNSRLVYVGHNILQSSDDAVRTSTNTVNLDVGAYYRGNLAVVNHTLGEVVLHNNETLNEEPDESFDIDNARLMIQDHVRWFKPVQSFNAAMDLLPTSETKKIVDSTFKFCQEGKVSPDQLVKLTQYILAMNEHLQDPNETTKLEIFNTRKQAILDLIPELIQPFDNLMSRDSAHLLEEPSDLSREVFGAELSPVPRLLLLGAINALNEACNSDPFSNSPLHTAGKNILNAARNVVTKGIVPQSDMPKLKEFLIATTEILTKGTPPTIEHYKQMTTKAASIPSDWGKIVYGFMLSFLGNAMSVFSKGTSEAWKKSGSDYTAQASITSAAQRFHQEIERLRKPEQTTSADQILEPNSNPPTNRHS